MPNSKITVVHCLPIWLKQTMTWIYSQVQSLPSSIENHIVCEQTQNLDQFNLPHIHSLQDASFIRKFIDKKFQKLGIRKHLGLLVQIIKQEQANIVHSHFGYNGWRNQGAVNKTNIKHVVTFYGVDMSRLPQQNPIWKNRYHALFEAADLFLCEGQFMAKRLQQL